MKKIIVKSVSGVATGAVLFFLTAAPTFAVNLCDTYQGIKGSQLCNVTVDTVVKQGINLVLFVGFVAALIFLIVGGIRWIISGGDKENTAKAKGTVTSALIGLAVIVASWILINIILTVFGGGGITNLVFPKLI